jgi:hypothetical protein
MSTGELPVAAWARYTSVVDEALCAADELRRAGGVVVPSVTRRTLGTLFQLCSVVTIVAHWRFAPIVEGDIIDADAIGQKLRAPENALQSNVAKRVAGLLDQAPVGREAPASYPAWIAGLLNAMVKSTENAYESTHAGRRPILTATGPNVEVEMTRSVLEIAFPRELRPAGVVELTDGFASIPELINAIPPDYDGVIDLSVCHSTLIAEPIKRARPRCLVISNRRPAALAARLIRYRYVLRQLALQPERFTDVVITQSRKLIGMNS